MGWMLITMFIVMGLGIIGLMIVNMAIVLSRELICKENNGITKTSFLNNDKCINKSGIYEIVYLNNTWRMIK